MSTNDPGITPEELSDRLKRIVNDANIPEWIMSSLEACPECDRTLDAGAVRGLGWKLNAQHLGNLSVDILCPNCHAGFELHYRSACLDFGSFLGFLVTGSGALSPVPHYKIPAVENNLVTFMIEEKSMQGLTRAMESAKAEAEAEAKTKEMGK